MRPRKETVTPEEIFVIIPLSPAKTSRSWCENLEDTLRKLYRHVSVSPHLGGQGRRFCRTHYLFERRLIGCANSATSPVGNHGMNGARGAKPDVRQTNPRRLFTRVLLNPQRAFFFSLFFRGSSAVSILLSKELIFKLYRLPR